MKKDKRYSPIQFKVKEVDRENYRIRFILSTPSMDRHGEVIDQKGWDLSNYLNNPVVLWAHDQSIPAVGKMVEIGMVGENLEGVVQFAYKESPFAAELFELYAGEYMSAGSVGFINNKWMYDETNDILTLLENELLEYSLVNVPANAQALSRAASELRAKGIDENIVKGIEEMAKAENRFKDLGEEVKPEEKPEEEKKPEEEVETTAPEKTETTEEEAKAALEVLCKSNIEVIKGAVKELTSRLNAPEADKKDNKVDVTPRNRTAEKRYSNADINRVIRSLLKGKEAVA